MWDANWRDEVWSQLEQNWDVIIIGGGITGAGILHEATRSGLRALLVEGHDFASGTSSRSSKLVHGGLRYLRNAQIRVTLESVGERERLLREGKGLINRLGFLFANLKGDPMPAWVFRLGLVVYDLLALRLSHKRYNAEEMRARCPPLTTPDLLGGYRYFDALTDDARLVLRLLQEAVADGGVAINYARVEALMQKQDGNVCGVVLADWSEMGERVVEIEAPVVINATGPWSDGLRRQIGRGKRLRLLRGSHLVIPASRLPLPRAVSFLHPWDGRPVFAIPWEGVVLMGTTDVDHGGFAQTDPAIDAKETEYLLDALHHVFPEQRISEKDIHATFSGIRAVVNTGKKDPSKESREHIIWYESGLLTVSGGKLTTFRLMAQDVLRIVRSRLTKRLSFNQNQRVLDSFPTDSVSELDGLSTPAILRLWGRYGANTCDLISTSQAGELTSIGETPTLWAELRWAARAEAVVHLDDLLLRRIRLGLLLPHGGWEYLERIRKIVQPELGWDNDHWQHEVCAYMSRWERSYQGTA